MIQWRLDYEAMLARHQQELDSMLELGTDRAAALAQCRIDHPEYDPNNQNP